MMAGWMLATYVVLGLAVIVQTLLVAIQTWEHHRFARSRLTSMSRCCRSGKAVVVVPCKGEDYELSRNLLSLFRQDHGDYELRFVVESRRDPAYRIIRRLIRSHREVPARIFLGGASRRSGQKVHNLRVATARLPDDVRYVAFVDSDARVRIEWLRAMLSRLHRNDIGAATGYRWFVPAKPTLANHLMSAINSYIAMFLGARPPTVVWGGSWAMRRDMFDALGIRAAWKGTLSDDLVASSVLRAAQLRVLFEPACMVASPCDTSLGEMLSFVRRQYVMGRAYLFAGWLLALLLTSLANIVFFGSVGLAVWAWNTGMMPVAVPVAVAVGIYALNVLAGILRQDAAVVYFPHLRDRLRTLRRFEIWSGPLVSLVNCLGMIAASLGRRIAWRGIVYELNARGRVMRIWRRPTAAAKPSAADAASMPEEKSGDGKHGDGSGPWTYYPAR
jgi:ceramide glucosyltransferase